jgi:hypothetical protein
LIFGRFIAWNFPVASAAAAAAAAACAAGAARSTAVSRPSPRQVFILRPSCRRLLFDIVGSGFVAHDTDGATIAYRTDEAVERRIGEPETGNLLDAVAAVNRARRKKKKTL